MEEQKCSRAKESDRLSLVEERISCLSGGIIKWLISCRPPRCLQKAAPRCTEISSEVCVHVLANDKYGCVCIFHRKTNSGKQPDIPVQLIHACASLRVCVGGRGGVKDQPSHVHSRNRVTMLNERQSELSLLYVFPFRHRTRSLPALKTAWKIHHKSPFAPAVTL